MMAAEVAEAETAGEAAPKKKGGKKKLLFIIAPILLLVIVGAGLYFSGILGGSKAKTGDKAGSSATAAAPPKPIETVFFDVPDMLVNLNTGSHRPSYLKLTISLQLESKDDVAKAQALMPRVIDTCQNYLRELRLEDLRGSAGLYRLREELQMRIGAALAPIKVDDVLFKDLLVQ